MIRNTQETILEHYTSLMGFRTMRQDPRQRHLWEKAIRKTILPLIPADRNIAILDMGCGDGALLQFLRNRGYQNLQGFDASRENVDCCRSNGLMSAEIGDILQIGNFHTGRSWDVLIAWDVIEHLPKETIVPMLHAARQRIAPGGCLLLQTPNMGSMFAAYCRHNDVTHETGFTENSLATVLQAAGFTTVAVYPAWRTATPAGWVRELGLRILHRLFWLFYGNGAPGIASANLIARAQP